jgi:hypothetical protein
MTGVLLLRDAAGIASEFLYLPLHNLFKRTEAGHVLFVSNGVKGRFILVKFEAVFIFLTDDIFDKKLIGGLEPVGLGFNMTYAQRVVNRKNRMTHRDLVRRHDRYENSIKC